ncbi:Fic family protein [Rugamonas violacea]|uniref:Fic family protein n=1 Tax=Rugamonas sp. CCM 8940 TaxID=2765359 RepID=UPI003670EA66
MHAQFHPRAHTPGNRSGQYRKIPIGAGHDLGREARAAAAIPGQETHGGSLRFLQRKEKYPSPVQLAAEMHERLVTIHPYIDGNGRTSRLLMNLILLQHGYPIANISADQRIAYYNALEKAQVEQDVSDFHQLVAKTEKASLVKYLAMVSGNVGEDAKGKGLYFFERIKDYL